MTNNQLFALFFGFCFVLTLRFFSLWFYKRRKTKNRKTHDFRKEKPLFSGRPLWPYAAFLAGLVASFLAIIFFISREVTLEYPKITKGVIAAVAIILVVVEVYFLNKRLEPMYERLRAIGRGEVTEK